MTGEVYDRDKEVRNAAVSSQVQEAIARVEGILRQLRAYY